ncbi:hypothetical protein CTAYLR_010257, partial [Chrysophaeum taylorii]
GPSLYQRAAHIASSLSLLYPTRYGSEPHESATRDEFREQLASYRSLVPESEAASQHESSPFVSARLGAKVAVVDFVPLSPAGSRWGLGGTCVNVGCIPKKLMHASALAGEAMRDDAAAFGTASAREAGIDYLNRLAAFEDAHALEVRNAKGETSTITAARFVVAVGGRGRARLAKAPSTRRQRRHLSSKKPPQDAVRGGGTSRSSALAFSLASVPRDCMVRSVAARLRSRVSKITDDAGRRGIAFQTGRVPTKIEKVGDVLRATGKLKDEQLPGALTSTLLATSSKAARTHAGRDRSGRRLARRLFGGGVDEPRDSRLRADHRLHALEFGTVGLTEDQARAECADLEVYVSEAFAKLLVDKADGTVLGFHYLGPNAGEVTQGFAVAMRCGATYDDFISTIGIHPTNAEEFCDLTITKASGLSPAKAGC